MKWAEELIGKIQSLSVRKADDPTSGDKGGGSIEDLAMEAANKMENGEIEPDEITPLARPYLERITRSRRLSIDARPQRRR